MLAGARDPQIAGSAISDSAPPAVTMRNPTTALMRNGTGYRHAGYRTEYENGIVTDVYNPQQ